MGDYGELPYTSYPSLLDWNTHPASSPYRSMTLANDTPLRNYRKVLSRVSKPSSAGNSPHSHPRRRTMTTYGGLAQPQRAMPTNLQAFSMHSDENTMNHVSRHQRQPRPTSWHPLQSHSAQPFYVPNCHPSWLPDASLVPVAAPSQQQAGLVSMYGLSTPITCPMSGDLLASNDYFTPQGELDHYLPAASQAYTPVEPPDVLYSEPSEWSTFGMEGQMLSDYPWMNQPSVHSVVSMDAAADFGHESVASADDLTAPPTPEQSLVRNSSQQQPIISRDSTEGNDLVGLGLYDEPQALSFTSSLLGGDFAYHPPGKGLKLEETFTPAPEDEDADADAEDDDDDDDDDQDEAQ